MCEEALLYPCLTLCHLLSQHVRTRQMMWGSGVDRAAGAGKGHGNTVFPQDSCCEEVDFLLPEVFKKRQNDEYQARYRRTSRLWMRINRMTSEGLSNSKPRKCVKIPKSKRSKHFELEEDDIDKVKPGDTRHDFLRKVNNII